MPDKDRFDAVVECCENNTLNHSEVCRTLTGNHDDRVTDTGTIVVVSTSQGLDGYNKTLTGDCAPTISGAACDIHHTHGVISTNSNGEDIAPTVNANMSKLGGDNQTTFGGGGVCR